MILFRNPFVLRLCPKQVSGWLRNVNSVLRVHNSLFTLHIVAIFGLSNFSFVFCSHWLVCIWHKYDFEIPQQQNKIMFPMTKADWRLKCLLVVTISSRFAWPPNICIHIRPLETFHLLSKPGLGEAGNCAAALKTKSIWTRKSLEYLFCIFAFSLLFMHSRLAHKKWPEIMKRKQKVVLH